MVYSIPNIFQLCKLVFVYFFFCGSKGIFARPASERP